MAGRIVLIAGNMFSGKSQDLIERVKAVSDYRHHRILCFKPDIDTRTPGMIRGRNGEFLPAFEVPWKHPEMIFSRLHEEEKKGVFYGTLVFDEVQFYPTDSNFYGLIGKLLETRDIFAAGLLLNFRGEPFGSTSSLIAGYARSTTVYRDSYCNYKECGAIAPYPQRLHKDGTPSSWNEKEILIDSGANYEPRCPKHFELPGRPDYV